VKQISFDGLARSQVPLDIFLL